MQKSSLPWGIVFFLLLFFWPVGIWLMVRKVRNEKLAYARNGRVVMNFGWVLVFLSVFCLFVGLSDGTTLPSGKSEIPGIIAMLIFMGGGGVALVIKGKQLMRRGWKYDRYAALIFSGNNTSIDRLATEFPAPVGETAKTLRAMLDAGLFPPNTYLDFNARRIVIPGMYPPPQVVHTVTRQAQASAPAPAPAREPPKPRAVKCPNCGATGTVLPGTVSECEYCGSPLA